MHVYKGHSSVARDPIEFLNPDIHRSLLQEEEERKVLRQRVRQLHVTSAARLRNPERKNRTAAIRLRFKRIGIERRSIVFDFGIMEPVQIMQHEPRSKTGGIPLFKVAVYSNGVSSKDATAAIELPVVVQV